MPETPDNSNRAPEDIKVYRLSEQDGDVLDALLANRNAADKAADGQSDAEVGFSITDGPMPAGSKERAEKMAGLLNVLGQYPADDVSEDLTVNTLAFIEQAKQRERFAAQIDMLSQPRRTLGISWRQIVSAAAVFVIGASLLIPAINNQQQTAYQAACASNLQGLGGAFGQYATDNAGALPALSASPGSLWWNVGKSGRDQGEITSNSAHLYLLARGKYVQPRELNCVSNANAPADGTMTAGHFDWNSPRAVSYSYQNMYGKKPARADDLPKMVILADKNPRFVFDDKTGALKFDEDVEPSASSRQHDSRGQNILQAGGVVEWLTSPYVMQEEGDGAGTLDNIWGASGVEVYTGRETPTSTGDVFLVP
ncbi:hypothetical protein KS4_31000 [Poriferisphaera corsica]|uniref:Uncharacterized protein n=2 Tax=Poriferisphaera corsica TaxID=2528020 RepID=A0A517YXS1_9BACT|nr:hypothetical protein KS4_31000 [Poriferisphaera corsica]